MCFDQEAFVLPQSHSSGDLHLDMSMYTSSACQTLQNQLLETGRNTDLEIAPGCQELAQKRLASASAMLHHLKELLIIAYSAACDHTQSIDLLQLAKHPLLLHRRLHPGYSLKTSFHHSWQLQQSMVSSL